MAGSRVAIASYLERPWAAYVTAVVLVLIAFALRYALSGLLSESAVGLLFAPAILVAAMMGGLWPGLFAAGISIPAVYYLVLIRADPIAASLFNILLFAVVGTTISWLGGLLHSARQN